jgi:hypothetical protein
MKGSPAIVALIASVLAVGPACSSSTSPIAAPRQADGSATAVPAAAKPRTTPVVATTVSTPLALLARLHAAGVACNYLPAAFQYVPGFSQIQCIRGAVSPAPKAPLDLVTLRVYDSAAAKARDLADLNSHNGVALVGPNWAAQPDPDFPLSVLRSALGGSLSR